jgi:hypothetical protein
VSAFNEVRTASRYKPRGYAIWRLGGEDPAIWKVLSERDGLDSGVAASLETGGRDVTYDAKRGLITRSRVAP